ncbi:MAG: HAD family hydrolase [Candidatus Woesearchaeota archaeon]
MKKIRSVHSKPLTVNRAPNDQNGKRQTVNGKRLVIFDLDNTLVDFFKIHDRAFHKTLKKLFKCEGCYKKVDFAGRIIPDSIRDMCKLCRIPAFFVEMNISKAMKVYEKAFLDAMPGKAKKFIVPGVVKLLNALKGKHKLALVTSDQKRVTKKILQATRLGRYFPIKIYGEDAKTRPERVKLAIEKSKHAGSVVVIGDSVHDVDAGKANNAMTIAMLTGPTTKERLIKHQPDFIFNNFKNIKKIIEAIER